MAARHPNPFQLNPGSLLTTFASILTKVPAVIAAALALPVFRGAGAAYMPPVITDVSTLPPVTPPYNAFSSALAVAVTDIDHAGTPQHHSLIMSGATSFGYVVRATANITGVHRDILAPIGLSIDNMKVVDDGVNYPSILLEGGDFNAYLVYGGADFYQAPRPDISLANIRDASPGSPDSAGILLTQSAAGKMGEYASVLTIGADQYLAVTYKQAGLRKVAVIKNPGPANHKTNLNGAANVLIIEDTGFLADFGRMTLINSGGKPYVVMSETLYGINDELIQGGILYFAEVKDAELGTVQDVASWPGLKTIIGDKDGDALGEMLEVQTLGDSCTPHLVIAGASGTTLPGDEANFWAIPLSTIDSFIAGADQSVRIGSMNPFVVSSVEGSDPSNLGRIPTNAVKGYFADQPNRCLLVMSAPANQPNPSVYVLRDNVVPGGKVNRREFFLEADDATTGVGTTYSGATGSALGNSIAVVPAGAGTPPQVVTIGDTFSKIYRWFGNYAAGLNVRREDGAPLTVYEEDANINLNIDVILPNEVSATEPVVVEMTIAKGSFLFNATAADAVTGVTIDCNGTSVNTDAACLMDNVSATFSGPADQVSKYLSTAVLAGDADSFDTIEIQGKVTVQANDFTGKLFIAGREVIDGPRLVIPVESVSALVGSGVQALFPQGMCVPGEGVGPVTVSVLSPYNTGFRLLETATPEAFAVWEGTAAPGTAQVVYVCHDTGTNLNITNSFDVTGLAAAVKSKSFNDELVDFYRTPWGWIITLAVGACVTYNLGTFANRALGRSHSKDLTAALRQTPLLTDAKGQNGTLAAYESAGMLAPGSSSPNNFEFYRDFIQDENDAFTRSILSAMKSHSSGMPKHVFHHSSAVRATKRAALDNGYMNAIRSVFAAMAFYIEQDMNTRRPAGVDYYIFDWNAFKSVPHGSIAKWLIDASNKHHSTNLQAWSWFIRFPTRGHVGFSKHTPKRLTDGLARVGRHLANQVMKELGLDKMVEARAIGADTLSTMTATSSSLPSPTPATLVSQHDVQVVVDDPAPATPARPDVLGGAVADTEDLGSPSSDGSPTASSGKSSGAPLLAAGLTSSE